MNKFTTISFVSTIAILLIVSPKINAQKSTNYQRERGAIVFDLPNTDKVIINKGITYYEDADSTLKLDVYYPPEFDFKSKLPVIIIAFGYPDRAGIKLLGSKFKDYIQFTSWCKLIAASGMIAIAYETINPKQDIINLSEFLEFNAKLLNIDINKIGAFTCSAHTPNVITTALNESTNIFKCLVVYYGFFLVHDFQYLTEIDSISERMGFVTATLPEPTYWKNDIPIMIVRAGNDNVPYINQSLDNFYIKALEQNLPINLINYPDGVHSFDVFNDNDSTRKIIDDTLKFWKFYLEE